MAELHSCYPSSPFDTRKKERKKGRKQVSDKLVNIEYKGKGMKSRRARRLLFLRPLPAGSSSSVHFGWELPDISGRQEVHHRFIALLHGEQLRDLHVSASARSPSRCFPHLFPERFLLASPSAAVAEQMLPRLGYRPASATAPPAFVIVSVSEPF
jgi:hypothetical protein